MVCGLLDTEDHPTASRILLTQPSDPASKKHRDDDTRQVRDWLPDHDVMGKYA